MSVSGIVFLSLGGLIFAAWAFQMFALLFAMRRRVAARTGRMFPGVGDSLAGWLLVCEALDTMFRKIKVKRPDHLATRDIFRIYLTPDLPLSPELLIWLPT